MENFKGKMAIVGIGEVPTGRFADRECIVSALESARQAILDAGINKNMIDTVITTPAVYSAQFSNELSVGRIVEELGLCGSVRNNLRVFSGGSSSSTMLKTACGLIALDMAGCVLCVHCDKLGTGLTPQAGIDLFAGGVSKEWEAAFGMHLSAVAGLITQRYLYETGTTEEQVAAVCVSNRKWAELNPNAMYRKPLTLEEVMSSKMLSAPLRAKESNMLADGGSAFIVTSTERAKEISDRPVYILGEGSRITHFAISQAPDMSRFSYAEAAEDAYRQAGLTSQDIDIAEIYDSYPVFQLIALEELGLVKRGEAGPFVLRGNTWPGGILPMTTNGGMLSQGHTGAGGGIAVLVETVRQLMGKAGDRQVKGARFAVETSTGGSYFDAHVTILGTEIP